MGERINIGSPMAGQRPAPENREQLLKEAGEAAINKIREKFGAIRYKVQPARFDELLGESMGMNREKAPFESSFDVRSRERRIKSRLTEVFSDKGAQFATSREGLGLDEIPLVQIDAENKGVYVFSLRHGMGEATKLEAARSEGRWIEELAIQYLHPWNYLLKGEATDTGAFFKSENITENSVAVSNTGMISPEDLEKFIERTHRNNLDLISKDTLLSRETN